MCFNKLLNIGSFHNKFYTFEYLRPIIVLRPEQLNFLITNVSFDNRLNALQKRTKDIFIFGCTVGLRFSDLIKLKKSNLEIINGHYHLKVISGKSNAYTSIKLPPYAIDIINRYHKRQGSYLLPQYSLDRFNINLKNLCELAGFTHLCYRTIQKRGNLTTNETTARFCDIASSHLMRRTAITTMLYFDMQESLVRKISGHSPNSSHFYRYVEYLQDFVDVETDKVFSKLTKPLNKRLKTV